MAKLLDGSDLARAAKQLRCDRAALEAVAEVEAAGSGFLPDGRVKVLFEGHWFHRYTAGRFDASYPALSFAKWTRAHYADGAGEWQRLSCAMKLDRRAALLSASYGRFQVMGFNFAICGYRTVEGFYAAMRRSEGAHLDAFCAYVERNGLADELREHRWADFARRYNGPEYRRNDYDGRLARAYAKHSA